MRDDHAEGPWITDDPAYPGGEARQIVINPADSKRIYVLFAAPGKSWLCLSKDGGASWTRIKESPRSAFTPCISIPACAPWLTRACSS